MDKYKKAVLRYERARQEVVRLDSERRVLLSSCENVKHIEEYNKNLNSYDLSEIKDTKVCLNIVWDDMIKWNKSEGPSGDRVSYEEVINFDSLDTFDGMVCDSCRQAYELKAGVLSGAKREFGAAKISIAKLGQGIIGG